MARNLSLVSPMINAGAWYCTSKITSAPSENSVLSGSDNAPYRHHSDRFLFYNLECKEMNPRKR